MADDWTPYEDYSQFSETSIPSECGCAVVGLISVRDCKGNVVGLLTPNDASIYHVNTIDVPVGYVKVFHPTTEQFLGVLTIQEAQDYLNFLNGLS